MTPPPARDGCCWRVALDTADDAASARWSENGELLVEARSCVALREARDAGARRNAAPTPELLSRLAQAAGIAPQWHDVDGAAHDVPRETILALLARLGLSAATLFQARESLSRLADETDRRAPPRSAVFREGEDAVLRLAASNGRRPSGLVVALEDGSEIRVGLANVDCEARSWRGVDGRRNDGVLARLPLLPLGRHLVTLDGADASCRLTIAPRRCHPPRGEAFERGAFGLSAQLYSLRREGDQGVGDFTTLARLSSLAGGHGAATLALNPLHALFAQNRERASPYYPSDRRFLEPFYLDLRRLDEIVDAALLREALGAEETAITALAAAREVDYHGVCALKRRVLERVFVAFDELARHRPDAAPAREFARFVEQGGASLFRFACFETINEARGGDAWRLWPQELREARGPALAEFAKEHAARVRFHLFLQWLCERQFSRAATVGKDAGLALGFCRDLAVGAAPDGAESWSNARQLVEGFSIGAPPDPFTRDGQVWGLPPPNPLAWKADGCANFAELLAANMRHAGALRIDHVMGLARLFVVPEGATARDGAYLTYPLDDLLGHLALESARANCVVIGEDLGTLPWGFREKLDAADVLSYRVLWFEREGAGFAPPSHYARKAMACVSTHDLPTLVGWWEGADIAEKAALGLLPQEAAEPERAARFADKRALIEALRREGLLQRERDAAAPLDDELAGAVHAYAARAPSVLAMAQVDDLAGEAVAVNLPGTDRERPNWRRKLALNLDDLFENSRARAVLAGLRRNLV